MMDSSLERGLHLTESETKYFGDLYTMCCDLSGQVTLEKALELFHSAHKPPSSTYPPPPSDAVRQVCAHYIASTNIIPYNLTLIHFRYSNWPKSPTPVNPKALLYFCLESSFTRV